MAAVGGCFPPLRFLSFWLEAASWFAHSRASISCCSLVMIVSNCQSVSPILHPMMRHRSPGSLFIKTDANRLPYVSAATSDV